MRHHSKLFTQKKIYINLYVKQRRNRTEQNKQTEKNDTVILCLIKYIRRMCEMK